MTEPYTTFVYKDSDGYTVAKDGEGKILDESNTAPEVVIKTGLDRTGILKIRGDFTCSSGLATQGGLKLKSHTLIDSGPETWIRVPNGYVGDLFVLDYTYAATTLHDVAISGMLNVGEIGSPQYLWDAVACYLKDPGAPASRGITMVDFSNLFVNNAKSALNIDLQHVGGWMTSCRFGNYKIFTTKRAIEFVNSAGITSIPGISSNTFDHFWYQSSAITDWGVKDVIGKNLWFEDVAIWDLQVSDDGNGVGSGHSASFTPYCGPIFVKGGIMMYYNLQNNAPKGKVRFIDSYTTLQSNSWQYYEEATYAQLPGSLTGSRVYVFAHGLGYAPKWIDVVPKSDDAMTSPIRWTWDTINIIVTYMGTPPPPESKGNLNNVKFQWRASLT